GADLPEIRVDDTVDALGDLGEALWREADREGLHTIDVTGSNGKTTTKEILRALWSGRGEVFATPGNYNNRIGLPLTLCSLPVDCDHLILELGSNAEGEIAELIRRAPGAERVITSIGADHLAGYGSVDGVRRAKAEIADCADESTAIVVPVDEREELPLDGPGEVWTFGQGAEASVRVREVRTMSAGEPTRVSLEWKGGGRTFELGLPGRHNASNLAAAVATGRARGVTFPPDVDERLVDLDLPAGRWRRVAVGPYDLVDDAYNANPTSVRASVATFTDARPQGPVAGADAPCRIAVLGEMAELGERADDLHERIAAEVAGRPAIDVFCAVGDRADRMADAAREAADDVEVVAVDDAGTAGEWLAERDERGMVWLKASRSARLERVIEVLEEA
ncbi:MAG: UDP-N-acetylmuramoyl-tripeptide--D-alanyl-D-alanine ligase, partial [Bradymonadaceae bacterium]